MLNAAARLAAEFKRDPRDLIKHREEQRREHVRDTNLIAPDDSLVQTMPAIRPAMRPAVQPAGPGLTLDDPWIPEDEDLNLLDEDGDGLVDNTQPYPELQDEDGEDNELDKERQEKEDEEG